MKGLAAGKIGSLSLDQLLLDDENPRLPERIGRLDQDGLLKYIERTYNPLVVAKSIVLHNYFPSEPLIVVKKGEKFVVVEGNRRLTALKLLADHSKRRLLGKRAGPWNELAQEATLPDDVPVIIAPSRASVAPIVGYRHISGIQEWDPLPKARYITKMIDDEEQPFSDVAELVGEEESEVRTLYRNYGVLIQAAKDYQIQTEEAEEHFSILTAALNRSAIRSYIGAPTPKQVSRSYWPVSDDKADELRDLLSWLFGDGSRTKVIAESRSLGKLASVLGSKEATKVLIKTRDLETASEHVGGSRDRLMRRLRTARTSLTRAADDIVDFPDDEAVIGLVDECAQAVEELREELE